MYKLRPMTEPEAISDLKFMRYGWLSPKGELVCCGSHDHLDALHAVGALSKNRLDTVKEARDGAVSSHGSCHDLMNAGEHPEWHNYEIAQYSWEKTAGRIIADTYNDGWTRLGFHRNGSKDILYAETSPETERKVRGAVKDLGFFLDMPVELKTLAASKQMHQFELLEDWIEREKSDVCNRTRWMRDSLSELAAGTASAPNAVLLLKVDASKIKVAPGHPKLCLDHVLIQFNDQLDVKQAALHKYSGIFFLDSYHHTDKADVFTVRFQDNVEGNLLKELHDNASVNLSDTLTSVKPPVLTVSLAEGASRAASLDALLTPEASKSSPNGKHNAVWGPQAIWFDAEVLLLRQPKPQEEAWLEAVGLTELRTLKDYQREASQRTVKPQPVETPKQPSDRKGRTTSPAKSGGGRTA